jgi:hypothetical protein
MLGMTSPISGDTNVHGGLTDLGANFAGTASNPTSVVAGDFVATVATIGTGGGCPAGAPTAYGGYDGCGCNTVISWDVSYDAVGFHIGTENWVGLQDDTHDATGTGVWEWVTECNYNVNSYHFSNPP